MEDVKDIEDLNEDVLIIGDLNRAVGGEAWGVRGNKDKLSPVNKESGQEWVNLSKRGGKDGVFQGLAGLLQGISRG